MSIISNEDNETRAALSVTTMEKQKRLEEIKDEIKDLHSLLKQVLPKLPGIKSSEYTHGQWERGADFLLQKYDETLDELHYIGVIAKVGTIKSDHADIEKQIDECSLGRFAGGGTKKIHLNEIWVLTTGNITEHAKEKIHEKYKARNVSFINSDKLIHLIDKTTPHYWLNVGAELGHYLASIRVRLSDIESHASLLQIKGQCRTIESDVTERDTHTYDKKPRREKRSKVNLRDEVLVRKICLIEGPMGSGKSHLLRHLATHFASNETYKRSGWLPVYCDWKGFVEKHEGSLGHLLSSELGALSQGAEGEHPKCIVFMDGLDETRSFFANGDGDAKSPLNSLLDEVRGRGDIKLVLATRPVSVVTDIVRIGSAGIFEIQPLSLKKIIAFITEACKELNLSKRLANDIRKSDLFRKLPQTPIAAILLTRLLTENQKELPSNLTELYAQSMEQMLGRWDISKGLATQKEYEASEQICFRLAAYLIDHNLPKVAINEARNIAFSYLRDRNLGLDPEKIFSYLVERSGVLAIDHERDTVSFRHRSFAEFMYAKAKRASSSLQMDARAFDVYWSNIYFFYIGLWKDCPDLLERLLGAGPITERQRLSKILSMPGYFLAAFSTPYEVVEAHLYKLFIEAATLFQEALEGKTSLSKLPELQLLWILQLMVRDSYSYEYFKKALDQVKIQIEDSLDLRPAVKSAAQFFVAVTAMDLGESDPFDFLLDKKDFGELPLSISFAVMEESKALDDKCHSGLLRKRNKKLRQLFSKNKGLREQLKTKSQTPLNALAHNVMMNALPSRTSSTRKRPVSSRRSD